MRLHLNKFVSSLEQISVPNCIGMLSKKHGVGSSELQVDSTKLISI